MLFQKLLVGSLIIVSVDELRWQQVTLLVHFNKQDGNGENIAPISSVPQTEYMLWSEVLIGTAYATLLRYVIRAAQVNHFDRAVFTNHYVLWLQVSVHDIDSV